MSRILDVGCGKAKAPGAIGIDRNRNSQADIIHDLDIFPWPLAANEFDLILCRHTIEHIADMIGFMEEVHRIARADARVEIVTPHFSNRFSFTDPTHLRHLSIRSFDYFKPPISFLHPNFIQRAFETSYPIPNFYTAARFKILHAHLSMARPFRLAGIQWLANRFPDFYELYLAFLFPARDLYFSLQALK